MGKWMECVFSSFFRDVSLLNITVYSIIIIIIRIILLLCVILSLLLFIREAHGTGKAWDAGKSVECREIRGMSERAWDAGKCMGRREEHGMPGKAWNARKSMGCRE